MGARVFFFIAILNAGALSAAEPNATIDVVFAGDIMLAETPGKVVARGDDPFAGAAEIFKGADVTIGNLECVVATTGEPFDKKYTFRAHPQCIPLLKKHFTALSVANNHSGDYGKEAFVEQLELLEKAKLPYFGGGRNEKEAHKPLIIERKGIRVALLGYNEFKPRAFEAGPDTPGLAWSVDEQVIEDIRKTRALLDKPAVAHEKTMPGLVIPFMHWGDEHDPANERQKTLARKMIDAGADAVIGGHPHVRQEIEYYRGKLIAYSLGNFVFDGFDEEEAKLGWAVRMTFGKDGLHEWKTAELKERARQYFDDDRVAAAILLYREVGRLAPEDAFAQTMHGDLLRVLGRWREAEAVLLHAHDIAPVEHRPAVAGCLAFLYSEHSEWEKAETWFQTTLADPERAQESWWWIPRIQSRKYGTFCRS